MTVGGRLDELNKWLELEKWLGRRLGGFGPCGNGRRRIALDAGAIEFVPARVPEPVFSAVTLQAADARALLAEAETRGCAESDATVSACGMRFRITPARGS